MNTITLPAINRTVPMAAYVAAVKKAKANPAATFPHGLTCWWPCKGAEIVEQFMAGVHDRINQGIPYRMRG